MTNVVLVAARSLGAVPFVEGPVSLTRPLSTVRVRFLTVVNREGVPRQQELTARTLTFDRASDTARIDLHQAAGRTCTDAASALAAIVEPHDRLDAARR